MSQSGGQGAPIQQTVKCQKVVVIANRGERRCNGVKMSQIEARSTGKIATTGGKRERPMEKLESPGKIGRVGKEGVSATLRQTMYFSERVGSQRYIHTCLLQQAHLQHITLL